MWSNIFISQHDGQDLCCAPPEGVLAPPEVAAGDLVEEVEHKIPLHTLHLHVDGHARLVAA
jgi:hypothetical protein